MKFTIAEHEAMLKNEKESYELELAKLERHKAQLLKLADQISIRTAQIAEAKRQKKDSFDADKFMKKRGKR